MSSQPGSFENLATNSIAFAGERSLGTAVGRRFEALELPGGWTVADLVAEQVAFPQRPWDRETADLWADVLTQVPGYAVLLAWPALEVAR